MNIEPDQDGPDTPPGGAELVAVEGAGLAVPPTEDYIVVPITTDDAVRSEAPTEFIAMPFGAFDDSAATWFDTDDCHAHRCRNLSRQETALTLHVYGGDLAQYFTYEEAGKPGQWLVKPQRSVIAGQLHA